MIIYGIRRMAGWPKALPMLARYGERLARAAPAVGPSAKRR